MKPSRSKFKLAPQPQQQPLTPYRRVISGALKPPSDAGDMGERYEASQALHAEKESAGVQAHMTYGELVAWLRQWRQR